MKILITGFDPFGGEDINPAYEVVKKVKDNICGADVIKFQVPTAFNESIKRTTDKISVRQGEEPELALKE